MDSQEDEVEEGGGVWWGSSDNRHVGEAGSGTQQAAQGR